MLKRLSLCLSLGFVTTLVIAWMCALAIDARSDSHLRSSQWGTGDTWSYWVMKKPGAIIVQRAALHTTRSSSGKGNSVPPWSRVRQPREADYSTQGTFVEDARGWPFVCLRSEREHRELPKQADDHGESLLLSIKGINFTQLPVKPIWTNLTWNVGLFALAWCMILAAPQMMRHMVRRRVGRCVQCGYDARYNPGLVCPECGQVQAM